MTDPLPADVRELLEDLGRATSLRVNWRPKDGPSLTSGSVFDRVRDLLAKYPKPPFEYQDLDSALLLPSWSVPFTRSGGKWRAAPADDRLTQSFITYDDADLVRFDKVTLLSRDGQPYTGVQPS
jgi:hypothetical protein